MLNGYEMAMGGIYHEIAPPGRLVCTESFDEKWYTGDALGTMVFTERGGTTTLAQTILYESKQARDMVLASEMEKGVTANFERLAAAIGIGRHRDRRLTRRLRFASPKNPNQGDLKCRRSRRSCGSTTRPKRP